MAFQDPLLTISIMVCMVSIVMNGGRFFLSDKADLSDDNKIVAENNAHLTELLQELQEIKEQLREQLQTAAPIQTVRDPIFSEEKASGQSQVLSSAPKALVLAEGVTAENVAHMEEIVYVLRRLGYELSFDVPEKVNEISLVWSFEWPFADEELRKMLSSQRINHFPEIGVITSKVDLATMRSGHVPMSFKMPSEFAQWKEYLTTKESEGMQWLTKSNTHRGIALIENPKTFKSEENSFVQQFISDPLLIDGFKVDIGMYVLVTSVLPLRVYVLDHEVWIRSCPEPYHPFDPNNTRKYVVDAHHKAPWLLPSFNKYYQEDSTIKQAFLRLLAERGFDGKAFFNQAEDIIRQVFGLVGHKLPSAEKDQWNDKVLNTNGISKHFDLVRFDFILEIVKSNNNNQLKPWLMEVNFSPNLCANVLPPNRRIYRQVLFDVFSVVGANYNQKPGFFRDNINENGFVSSNDIHVHSASCDLLSKGGKNSDCEENNSTACLVCSRKWPASFSNTLKQTTFEQMSRRHFRRIVPPEPTANQPASLVDSWLESVGYGKDADTKTAADKALATWLYFKCQNERRWCA